MLEKPGPSTTILPALTALLFCSIAAADEPLLPSPVHQLRIYEINDENRQAFHDRFRDHAARIMEKYGFDIVAMWESSFEDRTLVLTDYSPSTSLLERGATEKPAL